MALKRRPRGRACDVAPDYFFPGATRERGPRSLALNDAPHEVLLLRRRQYGAVVRIGTHRQVLIALGHCPRKIVAGCLVQGPGDAPMLIAAAKRHFATLAGSDDSAGRLRLGHACFSLQDHVGSSAAQANRSFSAMVAQMDIPGQTFRLIRYDIDLAACQRSREHVNECEILGPPLDLPLQQLLA